MKIILFIFLNLFIFNSCSSSKHGPSYSKIINEKYTITKYVEETLFQSKNNSEIFEGKSTKIANYRDKIQSYNNNMTTHFNKDDPYEDKRKSKIKFYEAICKNHQGNIVIENNTALEKAIYDNYLYTKKRYTNKSQQLYTKKEFCYMIDGEKVCTVKPVIIDKKLKGTSVPMNLSHKTCKKDNKEVFSYAISNSYLDTVKTLTGDIAQWWTINTYIHIPNQK